MCNAFVNNIKVSLQNSHLIVNVNVKYVEICLLYVKQDKVPVTKVGGVFSLNAYGYLLNPDKTDVMRVFSARRIGTFEQPALLTGLKVY